VSPFFQRGKVTKMGSREKKSRVRHSRKIRFPVPLFGKACPERSRREGPGEICELFEGLMNFFTASLFQRGIVHDEFISPL
jgi:hypothetical protein